VNGVLSGKAVSLIVEEFLSKSAGDRP
jgi:hypothetical protein